MAFQLQHLATTVLIIASISSWGIAQDPDVTQTHPCNTCCQGPYGLPGIPGRSGHNGLPGRDGIKGDIGSPGVGESGPRGTDGEKGGIGGMGLRGLPGKVGPRGEKGDTVNGTDGPRGRRGAKGQKGETGSANGQKSETGRTSHRSAFTATKESDQRGSRGDVLTFGRLETDIGNDFDLGTSKFTSGIPGVYWFTFTICRASNFNDPVVSLVKNGKVVATAYFLDAENVHHKVDQITNGAVLQLQEGDQVWLKFRTNDQLVHDNPSFRVTLFSGFLLYED